jgi:hypothetical protein
MRDIPIRTWRLIAKLSTLALVIAATACKAALHSETGAAAVDMESHIAAAYAAKAGIPFMSLFRAEEFLADA